MKTIKKKKLQIKVILKISESNLKKKKNTKKNNIKKLKKKKKK